MGSSASALLVTLLLASGFVAIYIVYETRNISDKLCWHSEAGLAVTTQYLSGRKLLDNVVRCQSMFSLLDGDKTSISNVTKEIQIIINGMRDKFTASGVWDREPYKKISKFIPAAINKKNRTIDGMTFDETLMQTVCGNLLTKVILDFVKEVPPQEEVSFVKLCMLWKQNDYTHELPPRRNILEKHDGKLPYLDCRMKKRFSKNEIVRCFRNLVTKKNASVLISFIGDSKVNQVFEALLVETKEMDYEIENLGQQFNLRDWIIQALEHHNHHQVTVSVRSAPGFYLTMQFETFAEVTYEEILQSAIYKKLLSWAVGEEPPPDLIVIGYSTWMSVLLLHPSKGRPTLTLMDDQWRIHAAVLRMLLNMRKNTRVLFLAQNIHKQHAIVQKQRFHNEKSSQDQWLYFSELGWLNLRKKFTSNYVPNYTRKNKSYFWRAVFASRRNAVSSPKNSIPFQGRFKILTEEKPSITDGSYESQQTFHSDAEGHGGIWFWDSTLPLSFASLRDCDTLFNHDPMSAKMISLAYNIDAFSHLTYVYGLLQKLNVSRDDFFQRVNRLSNKVHANPLFFELRPNAEKNSSTFFRQMKTFPGNLIVNITGSSVKSQEEFVNKLNEYYDTFATTYSMPDLYCRDLTHAGYLVKQVEATQILNMICNQFMDLDHNYCCNNNSP